MMSRYSKRDQASMFKRGEDEDKLYERQALIDEDQDLADDEINLLSVTTYGIRHRQPSNKSISNTNEVHRLENINGFSNNNNNRTRDFISEPFVEFTYYDIQPSDTLHSICLRYACSVNQVKRLNGLMTDQEFYGLRRIKLPLGKFGLLEDILKSKQEETESAQTTSPKPRFVNSPGSALSISTRTIPQFRPLLSPGFSSDRINELNKTLKIVDQNGQHNPYSPNGGINHSHSFSSLRELSTNDVNINIGSSQNHQHFVNTSQLEQQSFIKSNLNTDEEFGIGDLIGIGNSDNVEKVFEDLDYHVERAKVAAENYDQRAAELVDRIDPGRTSVGVSLRPQDVSKIPELFFCNETFGLNYKKLVAFIFIVCLVVPLVTYLNQSNVVVKTTKL